MADRQPGTGDRKRFGKQQIGILKQNASQPGGPWQAGAGGYIDIYIYIYTHIFIDSRKSGRDSNCIFQLFCIFALMGPFLGESGNQPHGNVSMGSGIISGVRQKAGCYGFLTSRHFTTLHLIVVVASH